MPTATYTPCPVDVTLKVIGGKWKPVILWHLSDGPVRFNQMHRLIGGITQKMLTQQLRELESDGLIARTVFPEVPPRVEYRLTEHGRTLNPVLTAMGDWGLAHATLAGRDSELAACAEQSTAKTALTKSGRRSAQIKELSKA